MYDVAPFPAHAKPLSLQVGERGDAPEKTGSRLTARGYERRLGENEKFFSATLSAATFRIGDGMRGEHQPLARQEHTWTTPTIAQKWAAFAVRTDMQYGANPALQARPVSHVGQHDRVEADDSLLGRPQRFGAASQTERAPAN